MTVCSGVRNENSGVVGAGAGKISGSHGPGNMGEKMNDLEAKLAENIFDHALCALRKRPILAQRLATFAQKSCKNERAKMKESRQNDREIKST